MANYLVGSLSVSQKTNVIKLHNKNTKCRLKLNKSWSSFKCGFNDSYITKKEKHGFEFVCLLEIFRKVYQMYKKVEWKFTPFIMVINIHMYDKK